MSTTVWYDGTYLEDKLPSTKCSLFVRYYQRTRNKAGRPILRIKRDIIVYDDAEAMAADIVEQHMRELPKEAEGDRRYIPQELRMRYAAVREVQKL